MALKPLDRLQPGMRTAAPVMGDGGVLLVAQGMSLTPELIEVLRRRKISSVDVVEPTDAPRTAAEAPVVDVESVLRHAFEPQASHPVMQAILAAALEAGAGRQKRRP